MIGLSEIYHGVKKVKQTLKNGQSAGERSPAARGFPDLFTSAGLYGLNVKDRARGRGAINVYKWNGMPQEGPGATALPGGRAAWKGP